MKINIYINIERHFTWDLNSSARSQPERSLLMLCIVPFGYADLETPGRGPSRLLRVDEVPVWLMHTAIVLVVQEIGRLIRITCILHKTKLKHIASIRPTIRRGVPFVALRCSRYACIGSGHAMFIAPEEYWSLKFLVKRRTFAGDISSKNNASP